MTTGKSMLTVPKYVWLNTLKCKVEILGRGHFEATYMVRLASGQEMEVDGNCLETLQDHHTLN